MKTTRLKDTTRPFGIEIKVASCGTTGIVFCAEVQEGKESMRLMEYHDEHGATTANVLRMTRPYHGTGRVVIADSWFGSVKSALALLRVGLFAVLNVKTAHSGYPRTSLNALAGIAQLTKKRWQGTRGKTTAVSAKVPMGGMEKSIFAAVHFIRKPMYLVATAGSLRLIRFRLHTSPCVACAFLEVSRKIQTLLYAPTALLVNTLHTHGHWNVSSVLRVQ